MIYIGTSGYSYDDWVGSFYSEDIKKGEMLEAYSNKFNFTEINSTYYSMPNKYMFFNLVKKTPEGFKFTVKLHGSMTHSRDANEISYRNFNEAIMPLYENNKLGCLVAQFPYSFHYNNQNMEYIIRLHDNLKESPVCVEFRNSSWMKADIYKQLNDAGIGFVCVDEPDIKGLIRQHSIVTSNIGYVRFHGRNTAKWYNHEQAYERYDYLYKEDELKEWLPRIEFIDGHSDITFIAFNNHFKAQGAVNASMLQRLIGW